MRKLFISSLAMLLVWASVPVQTAHAVVLSPCETWVRNNNLVQWKFDLCSTVEFRGHRANEAPDGQPTNENTIPALNYADSIGAGCESDTWPLKSDSGVVAGGEPIIFHDELVGTRDGVVTTASMQAAGVTAGTPITNITLAQFRLLRSGKNSPLPTLKEWVQRSAELGIKCAIELKYDGLKQSYVQNQILPILQAYNAVSKVTFYQKGTVSGTTCNTDFMTNMIGWGLQLGFTQSTNESSPCFLSPTTIKNKGFKYVILVSNPSNPSADQITFSHVKTYRDLGLKVGNNNSGGSLQWKDFISANLDFIVAGYPKDLKDWLRG